jgi:hypothetical protein
MSTRSREVIWRGSIMRAETCQGRSRRNLERLASRFGPVFYARRAISPQRRAGAEFAAPTPRRPRTEWNSGTRRALSAPQQGAGHGQATSPPKSLSLQDRLSAFAEKARDEASILPTESECDALLKSQALGTAQITEWANSTGLQAGRRQTVGTTCPAREFEESVAFTPVALSPRWPQRLPGAGAAVVS